MAYGRPFRKDRITADLNFLRGPVIYHGGILRATAGGAATVDIYDANDAEAGLLGDLFRAAASEHDQHLIDPGIEFLRGLFVDIGANVADFILYHDVIEPERTAGPD